MSRGHGDLTWRDRLLRPGRRAGEPLHDYFLRMSPWGAVIRPVAEGAAELAAQVEALERRIAALEAGAAKGEQ